MNRRTLRTAILDVASLSACLILLAAAALAAEGPLERRFAVPPDADKAWCYWWWLDSAASKEGITADLESMRKQGIAGALIFDAGKGGEGAPGGPVFMSEPWRELFRHALREADRCGIALGVNLCSGWDCGGSWVTPELAVKKLTWSATTLTGASSETTALAMPKVEGSYYRDIAVLAMPLWEGEAAGLNITASSSFGGRGGYPPENAIDGAENTRWISNGNKPGMGPRPGHPEYLQFHFSEPAAVSGLRIVSYRECSPKDVEIMSSSDGITFKSLCRFTMKEAETVTRAFGEVREKWYRVVFHSTYSYRGSKESWNVQVCEAALLSGGKPAIRPKGITNLEVKAGRAYSSGPSSILFADTLAGDDAAGSLPGPDCRLDEVLDLTSKMDKDGRLAWRPERGNWRVLRFGYTLLGTKGAAKIKCVSPGSEGYEIDFFNPQAFEQHFAHTGAPLLEDARKIGAKSLKYFHVDSYEAGCPSWTGRFREEFAKRRGYDMTRWMPVLAGRVVESSEASHRFLWDVRRTIGDLYAENYYGKLRELAHAAGVQIHPESSGPFWHHIDALQCAGGNDIPMTEFWKRKDEKVEWTWHLTGIEGFVDMIKQGSSAAHVYGKPVCQAEAYTSMGPNWEEDFFDLKDMGDRAFCAGLTRNVLCFWVHQSKTDAYPGYQWEGAGTHFDNHVTWFAKSHAWLTYLARCQGLLKQGRAAADFCYFYGEDVPNFVPARSAMTPPLPAGYDCDTANAEVLLTRMAARDGRIVLPDGMSYRYLVVPHRQDPAMSLTVLKKIKELVESGVTVIGPAPRRAQGLTGWPRSDEQVRALAAGLWGEKPGEKGERKVGQGRVIWGKTLEEIVNADGLAPDVEFRGAKPASIEKRFDGGERPLEWIHRRDGDTDIYFVANMANAPVSAQVACRTAGSAELWDAVTGEIRPVTFRAAAGRSIVPLRFAPRQSFFLVFRGAENKKDQNKAREGVNFPESKTVATIEGGWQVTFDPKFGGPAAAVNFSKLEDWTKRPEPGIKYYSGTAIYHKTFDFSNSALRTPRSALYLDLGRVRNVAEVRLNGKSLGVVWTAPWRVKITDALKAGANELEIEVVNLWPNRLIGDAGKPRDQRITVTNVKKFEKPGMALLESGLIGPVTVQAETK